MQARAEVADGGARRSRGPRRPRAVSLAAASLLAVVATAAGSFASASSPRLTELQRGLDFYRGQTITFVTGSVGGGTDLTARALAPLLGSYLHASINVVNAGQANGIPGQDALAAADPNGLEIGYVNAGSIASEVFQNQPGFDFNPGRLSYIVGEEGTPTLLVSSPSSPFSSFAAVKHSATPGKVLAEVPSQGTSGLEILLGILGVHVQLVTGYSTTSAVAAGFQRGDGPMSSLSYPNAESLMAAGLAKPIATSVMPPPGTADRQYVVAAPTYAELLKQYLPKNPSKKLQTEAKVLEEFVSLGQPIITQARVADDKLQALRAAVEWAFKQPSYKELALAAGSSPQYIPPVQAKAAYNSMIANGSSVACFLAGTC